MNFLAQKILLIILMFKITSALSIISPFFNNETEHQLIRSKRIIWGTPLTDSQSPFQSPKWFANICKGSDWTRFRMDMYRKRGITFLGQPEPSPGGHWCGGSMLTPSIVGTAGHCISDDVYTNETFDRCERRNGWENYFAVFVGYFTEQDAKDNLIPGSWAWSKKFLVHEQCGIIIYRKAGNSVSIYDFGLIILDRDITFPKPGTHVVPLYDYRDILNMYNSIQRRESICLVIGFGSYYWKSRGVYGDQSTVMMHGWRSVRNYNFCSSISSLKEGFMKYLGYSYRRWQSDICHTFFGKVRAQTMTGDSGGPVTCDNIYVGLNSEGTHVDKFEGRNPDVTRSYGWAAAIAFALEWHSAQYRQDFLKYSKEYAAIPELRTTKVKPRAGIFRYFHHQEAKPNDASTLWILPKAVYISMVLNFYKFET